MKKLYFSLFLILILSIYYPLRKVNAKTSLSSNDYIKLDSMRLEFMHSQDTTMLNDIILTIDSIMETDGVQEALVKEKMQYLWVLGRFDDFLSLSDSLLTPDTDSLEYYITKLGYSWLKNENDSINSLSSKILWLLDKKLKTTKDNSEKIILLNMKKDVFVLLDEKNKAKSVTRSISSFGNEYLPLLESFESDYSAERNLLLHEKNRYIQYLNSKNNCDL